MMLVMLTLCSFIELWSQLCLRKIKILNVCIFSMKNTTMGLTSNIEFIGTSTLIVTSIYIWIFDSKEHVNYPSITIWLCTHALHSSGHVLSTLSESWKCGRLCTTILLGGYNKYVQFAMLNQVVCKQIQKVLACLTALEDQHPFFVMFIAA